MFSFKNQKGEKLYILDENVYLESPWTVANYYTLPFFAHYLPELTGLAKIIYMINHTIKLIFHILIY